MPVLQYVGARYVPKLFENPDGTAEWAASTSYEPLTIVLYNNSSYTSRKPVPATVGAPPHNPEYWAPTGNYNGALQDVINEVNSIQEELSRRKRIVLIGDSYLAGYTGVTKVDTFGNRMASLLGLEIGSEIFIYGQGGASFGGNYPYVDQLNEFLASGNTCDEIWVCGGSNDTFVNYDTEITAGAAFFSKVPSGVKVNLIFIGNVTNAKTVNAEAAFCAIASNAGAGFYDLRCLVVNQSHFIDTQHPDVYIQQDIAEALAQIYNTGHFQYTTRLLELPITWENGWSGSIKVAVSDRHYTVEYAITGENISGTHYANTMFKIGQISQSLPFVNCPLEPIPFYMESGGEYFGMGEIIIQAAGAISLLPLKNMFDVTRLEIRNHTLLLPLSLSNTAV